MKYIVFVHYFFINLFGFGIIPNIIQADNKDWFSVIFIEGDKYCVAYSRYINKKDMETLCYVKSKFKYLLYLKTIARLWQMRRNIVFDIDIN